MCVSLYGEGSACGLSCRCVLVIEATGGRDDDISASMLEALGLHSLHMVYGSNVKVQGIQFKVRVCCSSTSAVFIQYSHYLWPKFGNFAHDCGTVIMLKF